jgi:3-hydroxyisobutyrate dehydrogenase
MRGKAAARHLIGFLGIGTMGNHMAKNLLAAGYRLLVCDRDFERVHNLTQQGAIPCTTPAEMASTPGLHAIISMLPSSKHVKDAYLGPHGILSLNDGTFQPHLLIDSSTIDPITSTEIASAAESTILHPDAAGSHGNRLNPFMVDAPVSGGVPGAQAATLTFMVGGTHHGVEAATPILNAMGKRIIHCGNHGAGQAAKLANNLVLAISMAAVSEGLAFGMKLGLDPKLLTDIFNSSSARCWSSDVYNPCPGVMDGVPSSRGYQGGFASKLMVKDLGLAEKAGEAVDAYLPMCRAAKGLYKKTVSEKEDGADLDFSAIFETAYLKQ